MNRILTVTTSALILAGCADTDSYDRAAKPAARKTERHAIDGILTTILATMMLCAASLTAMAQQGHAAGDWELRVKFTEEYAARNYKAAIADGTAFMKRHPFDHEMPRLMAQAYYLSRDKPGCVNFIKQYLNPWTDDIGVELLARCQASKWQVQP